MTHDATGPLPWKEARAFFFDAADTLFRVRGSVGHIYWEVARRYHARTTPEEINLQFALSFRRSPPMIFPGVAEEELPALERDWWKRIVRETFRPLCEFLHFDQFFDEVFELFRTREGWVLFPETRAVLTQLRRTGRKLGIVSNFDSRLFDVCQALGIAELLDTIVTSSRTGYAKPDPEIFRVALREVGAKASEAVHTGDSVHEDVEGARAAGLAAILLDREDRHGGQDCVRIASLEELHGE
ncbi:MAG: HAD-IA family hydrolase [Acidobacteria bacterium]|nr:HAD-IA family hydrolase [Acidobacteriota bacterium]